MLKKIRRPYPLPPRRKDITEPSLDWRIRAIVAAVGAKRALTPELQNRLEMCGILWSDLAPVMARIRSAESWAREWMREAEQSEAAGAYDRAAAQAFLGQVIVSPHHPVKGWFQATLQRCHLEDRKRRFNGTVERITLMQGRLVGIWERPAVVTRIPVLLMPPLASTKEELAVLSNPLLNQGHSVLRLDIPGQGESPCPLRLNTEELIRDALDEMGFSETEGIIVGGISLGSYFGLRLAAIDPKRVRAAFAVSPPAIVTEEDWARQIEIIWQYLDIYFGCGDRSETHQLALNLHMNGLAEEICCPVLMYQGTRDRINVPNARELYREFLKNAEVTDFLLPDLHACPWHLGPRIAPEVVQWIAKVTESTKDAPRR